MVNAPRMHQERRATMLTQMQSSIEKTQLEGKKIDYNEFVVATMSNLNVSRRTAIEYLEVVLFRLGIKKEELEKIS